MLTTLPTTTRMFAGLSLDRPLIMGVVNVTPDSFSDGGAFLDAAAAVAHGRRLAAEGADIIDVGGESTRPGAEPVAPDVEASRVLPVVEALAKEGLVISIDTRHAAVMRRTLEAGARIVNDVTALTGDRDSLAVVAAAGASVILMHMQGAPTTMQRAPRYADVAADVRDFLASRVAACRSAGLPLSNIAVDPGIGFGKTDQHNLTLLRELERLREVGAAVLIGVSRKSFIARLSQGEDPAERLGGSLAAALAAVQHGADILRVHDVGATRQALAVWRAITGGGRPD